MPMPEGRTPQGVRGLKLHPIGDELTRCASHSARSAWIETRRGLSGALLPQSHSARSAWIETSSAVIDGEKRQSRTPQGVRGLKPLMDYSLGEPPGRTPQGVRGLKPCRAGRLTRRTTSHSARSAWIETNLNYAPISPRSVALRKECVD